MRIKGKRNVPYSGDGLTLEQISDENLAAQVVQGDSTALESLYDRYAPIILGIALKATSDQAAAEDVLQETFWRVWRYAATYKPQLGPFSAWLFRIARNLVVDLHRRQSIRPQAVGSGDPSEVERTPDPDADVLEQAQSFFKNQQVRAAVDMLPKEQQQVIEMAYYWGMTRQEIAEATGESLGTIHSRARLGLQKLRRELERQKFEG